MELNDLIQIFGMGTVFGFGFSAFVGLIGYGIKACTSMIANN